MDRRVVITGLGVCAPNGVGLNAFTNAIKEGVVGIKFQQKLADLKFGCQIAGEPELSPELLANYFTPLQLRDLAATGIFYGMIAGVDAWKDAGLPTDDKEAVDYDTGIVFGTSTLGVDKLKIASEFVDNGRVKRLGSSVVIQTMSSGISAYLGGYLGAGNQVTTNSSACTTGTESILMGYERIKYGKAERMLVGGCNDSGPYIWGGFDAMRVLTRGYNDNPEEGSRPMAADATGFVPGSGGGALVLESLESAQTRGAHIYAEVLGGAVNSGGQRGSGSMTAPNSEAVQRCIREAITAAGIDAKEIDTINGHLTATGMCPTEVKNWSAALNRTGTDFPYINSLKSMTGHCLAAAGSIEAVAGIIQLEKGWIFGNVNCEDIHPEILEVASEEKIVRKTVHLAPKVLAKASFGFGDVNCCMIFRKFEG